MEKYAIIHNSEDGVTVSFVDKAELLRRITPDSDGFDYYGRSQFASTLPDRISADTQEPIVILKCELVVPKVKEVITEYTVD